jgi:hypothetical protein
MVLPAESKMLVVWFSLAMACTYPSGLVSLGSSLAISSASAGHATARTLQEAAEATLAAAGPSLVAAAWLLLRWALLLLSLWWLVTMDDVVHPSSEAFGRARQARRKGEHALFVQREPYFLLAAQLLGCPPPSELGTGMALVWQVGRQALHLVWVGRAIERRAVAWRGVEPSMRELAHAFLGLAHQYTSAGHMPLRAWVALLRAVNLAECCGDDDNPLLAELYSALAFHIMFRLDRIGNLFPHRWSVLQTVRGRDR